MEKDTKSSRNLEFTYTDYTNRNKNLQKSKIDRYYIFEKIGGTGEFGIVYRGMNGISKKQVAIKVIQKRTIQNQTNPALKRLKRRLIEAQSELMQRVNSENVLKCYEVLQNRDLKIMITEYCNDGSLFDLLSERGRLPQDEAVTLFKQVLNGVSQCHRQKIIHRDLKLQNIVIHNGECKIADFGFSKELKIQNQNEVLKNTALGSLVTMAPEVMCKQKYGLKADIWSLGVIFFQLLIGKNPFKIEGKDIKACFERSLKMINSQEKFQDIQLSKQAKKFIRQVLVIDQKKRLGWKQILDHQLFKVQRSALPTRFYRRVELKRKDSELQIMQDQVYNQNNSQLMVSGQSFMEEKQSEKSIQFIENLLSKPSQQIKPQIKEKSQKIQKEQSQKIENQRSNQNDKIVSKLQPTKKQDKFESQNKPSFKSFNKNIKTPSNETITQNLSKDKDRFSISQQEIIKAKKEINRQDDEIFKWAQRIHKECLRAEFIYNNIIKVIEKQALLDLNDRESLELMFLICTRCRNNISPIYNEYAKRKQNKIIQDLKSLVEPLYRIIVSKWNTFSNKLTDKQNQKFVMFKDFFSKRISSDFQRKDRFLSCVESMQEFKPSNAPQKKIVQVGNQTIKQQNLVDYTKQQQIEFTNECIQNILKKIKYKESNKQLKLTMKNFKRICIFESKELKPEAFRVKLKQISQQL